DVDVHLEGKEEHFLFPLDDAGVRASACLSLFLGGADARVDDLGDVLHRLGQALFDDRLEEVFLAVEGRVHRALGEPRLLGHLVERGGDVATAREDGGGGVDELSSGPGLLPLARQPVWRLLLRHRVRLPRPARARGPYGRRAPAGATRGGARSPTASTA